MTDLKLWLRYTIWTSLPDLHVERRKIDIRRIDLPSPRCGTIIDRRWLDDERWIYDLFHLDPKLERYIICESVKPQNREPIRTESSGILQSVFTDHYREVSSIKVKFNLLISFVDELDLHFGSRPCSSMKQVLRYYRQPASPYPPESTTWTRAELHLGKSRR